MCTVTYLPLKGENQTGDFILTSNRDEKTTRPSALIPEIYTIHDVDVIFPKDPQGQGTWIAASEFGNVVCLLNGAFVPHIPKVSYKHSRGKVVTNYFEHNNATDFYRNYDFSGIEPFTLVIVENEALSEIKWDGGLALHTHLPLNEPHIWSSVTLYSPEIVSKRELWFQEWLNKNEKPENIVDFHTFGGEGDKSVDIKMDREGFLKTVSISSIRKVSQDIHFQYIDLKNSKKYDKSMSLETIHE